MIRLSLRLAWRDYCHEWLLSLCSILALLAVLAPLMVLGGVRFGIISSLTNNLRNDPRNLEIIPAGSGHYAPAWFAQMAARDDVAFIIPQTRSIAAVVELYSPLSHQSQIAELIPSAPGDPLLQRWDITPPHWEIKAGEEERPVPLVLTDMAARRLGLTAGAELQGSVERVYQDQRERVSLPLLVSAVLPAEAQQKIAAYVPLDLLIALEDYRDGWEVADLHWSGRPKPQQDQLFATFRLYAADLDAVRPLSNYLVEKEGIQTTTRAAEIEMVRNLDHSFMVIFWLIAGAGAFGFVASVLSSALSGDRRKSRSLAVLRLMGFPARLTFMFPVWQSTLTGILGYGLSCLLYSLLAYAINSLFAEALPSGQKICLLLPQHFVWAGLFTVGLCAAASLGAASQAAAVDPAEAIREL
jgi:putative ABC transport system permease protein